MKSFDLDGVLRELKDRVNEGTTIKYLFIASFSLVTAFHDRTIGEVFRSDPWGWDAMRIMEEAVGIVLAR